MFPACLTNVQEEPPEEEEAPLAYLILVLVSFVLSRGWMGVANGGVNCVYLGKELIFSSECACCWIAKEWNE